MSFWSSLLPKEQQEQERQNATGDDKFYKEPVYLFELRVPEAAGAGSKSFLFPLVLGPQQLSIEEPFSVATTETQGAGMSIERNGIIQRTIKLRGSFGFAPKPYTGDDFSKIKPPEGSAVRAEILKQTKAKYAFSGQRHFQFLQDGVFRMYSDLLQNPKHAKETALLFHNLNDDEHWRVEPRRFVSDRSASASRLTHPWDIELLAYGVGKELELAAVDPDKSWIDKVKDVIASVTAAVNLAKGCIRQATAYVDKLDNFVSGIAQTINNIVNIIGDVADFVSGVADLIVSPMEALNSVIDNLSDNIAELAETLDASVNKVSTAYGGHSGGGQVSGQAGGPLGISDSIDDTVQNLRQLQDALHDVAKSPQLFQESATGRSDRLTLGDGKVSVGTDADSTAAQEKAAGTLAVLEDFPSYQSASEYVVKAGDTLPSLAARFLGSAKRWRVIAALNNLSAPHISAAGQPGTRRVGESLLIPSTEAPPERQESTVVLGVPSTESAESRLLGTDAALSSSGAGFDLCIDTDSGGADILMASGMDNLKQAVVTRTTVEKGSSVLYPSLGREGIVATRNASIDHSLALFRFKQAVLADPRVVSIDKVFLHDAGADALSFDLDVSCVSFTNKVPVQLEIRK